MSIYRQNPRTAGRVLAGSAFVITPDDHRMHTLNAAASEIWLRAAEGCTVEEAAQALFTRYQVDMPTARRDAQACCSDLVARSILVAE